MAQAMIMPKKYFFDDNGNPLSFGKVFTYAAGTTDPQVTWVDENKSAENTNPIILNERGYAEIYLDGSYNIEVFDQNDNQIWTADPVTSIQEKSTTDNIADLTDLDTATLLDGSVIIVKGYYEAGDGGGGDFYWDASSTEAPDNGLVFQPSGGGIGRFKRLYESSINIKWFGAVGDGSVDDTAACNSWISAIKNFVGFVPTGQYLISSTIAATGFIEIVGEFGYGDSGVSQNSSQFITNDENVTIMTYSGERIKVNGITFVGAGRDTGGIGNGLEFIDTTASISFPQDARILNCWFTQIPLIGLKIIATQGTHILNSVFEGASTGMRIGNSSEFGQFKNCIVSNNRFFNNSTYHFEVRGDNNVFNGSGGSATELKWNIISNNVFDTNGDVNSQLTAILLNNNFNQSDISNNVFHNSGQNDVDMINCVGLNFNGNTHDRTGKSNYIVRNASSEIEIWNNNISDPNHLLPIHGLANIDAIQVFGASENIRVEGNTIRSWTASTQRARYGIFINTGDGSTLFSGMNNISGMVTANTNFVHSGNPVGANFLKRPVFDGGMKLDTQRVMSGTAMPTSGAWNTGDIVFMRTSNVGDSAGYYCVSGGNPGTWRRFGTIGALTATTAALNNASSSINASNDPKIVGLMVYNTDTNKPVWADGGLSTAVWVDATGAVAHTPV